MLSTNQITVFFDRQYLWKESIDILYFLHGNNHQGNLASETTTFGWVWPVVPLIQSDCRFFDHQFLWKESIDVLVFFTWS